MIFGTYEKMHSNDLSILVAFGQPFGAVFEISIFRGLRKIGHCPRPKVGQKTTYLVFAYSTGAYFRQWETGGNLWFNTINLHMQMS